MCGKFTAMKSWREVWEAANLIPGQPVQGSNDEPVTYRVMNILPVIIYDHALGMRRVVPMQWAFPHRSDPRRPDIIHVRSETIDQKPAFRDAFAKGQRGIVVMRTFNEGLELPNGKTEQWTIDPGDEQARGFAFLWRRFAVAGRTEPMFACVMATVPASKLVSSITDRMPAILEDDAWAAWLGEVETSPEEAKALLKTMEGVDWKMEPEPKAPKSR